MKKFRSNFQSYFKGVRTGRILHSNFIVKNFQFTASLKRNKCDISRIIVSKLEQKMRKIMGFWSSLRVLRYFVEKLYKTQIFVRKTLQIQWQEVKKNLIFITRHEKFHSQGIFHRIFNKIVKYPIRLWPQPVTYSTKNINELFSRIVYLTKLNYAKNRTKTKHIFLLFMANLW